MRRKMSAAYTVTGTARLYRTPDLRPRNNTAPYAPEVLTVMTTIGASLTINGQVTSREDITIHGRVIGEIAMEEGALLVAPTANIDARVRATRLTIHGTMAGDIAAAERVELTDTAAVSGTLLSPAVIMREGAFFNGAMVVDGSSR
jgi:cytoskeletal protein CcmA (bactofilin family)